MKKNNLVLIINFLLAAGGFSQRDFRNGYVITNAHDTLHGMIEYRGNKSNARKCIFIDSNGVNREPRELTPQDIIAYRFTDGKFYVAQLVNTGDVEEVLFLEYLIQGKVDVFYYREGDDEHYMIKKEGQGIVPLTNEDRDFYIDGNKFVQPSNRYIGLLIGPIAGINLDFLSRVRNEFDPSYYYFADSHWEVPVNPSAGLSLGLNLVSLNERMFLQYDMTFHTLHFKTTTITYDPVTNLNLINDISCKEMMLNNTLVFKYEMTPGGFRPTVMGGGFIGYLFNADYHRHLEACFATGGTDPLYTEDDYRNPFNNLIFGITVGAGAMIRIAKAQQIFVDMKYYSGLGIFENLNTNLISLNVGVPFQLVKK